MRLIYNNIDLNYLVTSCDGNKDFILEMVHFFVEEVALIKERLLKALNNQDWPELSKVAHKSKSSLLIVGNQNLVKRMNELELLAKKKEEQETYPDRVTEYIKNTELIINELNNAVKNL